MKTKNALERKRPLLFTVGVLFAASLALVSFEWRTPYEAPTIPDSRSIIDDEVVWVLPIKLQEAEEQPERPEPPKKQPELFTEFDIVDKDPLDDVNMDDLVIDESDLVDVQGPLEAPVEDDVDDIDLDKVWE